MDFAGLHLPTALSVLATFTTIQGFFWHLEKVQSRDNRRFVGRWLMRMTPPDAEWTGIVLELFVRLFGENHWRLRCFVVSSLMTITAWALAAWQAYRIGHSPNQSVYAYFEGWIMMSSVAICACVFDFLSLWVTRRILWKVSLMTRWISVLGFVLIDLWASCSLFLAIMIVNITLYSAISGEWHWSIEAAGFIIILMGPMSLFLRPPIEFLPALLASLVTSSWLWSYLIVAQSIRLLGYLPPIVNILSKIIDIKEHPVRSIGTVIAFVAAGIVNLIDFL